MCHLQVVKTRIAIAVVALFATQQFAHMHRKFSSPSHLARIDEEGVRINNPLKKSGIY